MAAKQWTFEIKVSYVPLPREKEAAYRQAWMIIGGMIQEANRQVKAELEAKRDVKQNCSDQTPIGCN